MLSAVAGEVGRQVAAPRDTARALLDVMSMQKKGELNEKVLLEFVNSGRHEETVSALALLCSASLAVVEPLMRNPRNDGILVPCKAANLNWATVRSILKNRFSNHSISDQDIGRAEVDYDRLSQSTAQRVLRFWQVRTSVLEYVVSEKREGPRRLTLEAGTIEFDKMAPAVDCAILDIANGGACVLVPNAVAIAETFCLTINFSGVKRTCSVAWRSGSRIGVSFQDAAPGSRTASRLSVGKPRRLGLRDAAEEKLRCDSTTFDRLGIPRHESEVTAEQQKS